MNLEIVEFRFLIYIILAAIVSLVAAIIFYRSYKNRPQLPPPLNLPEGHGFFDSFRGPDFHRDHLSLEGQSQAWRDAMSDIGKIYCDHRVGAIYHVHGTFTGHDPIGFISFLKSAYPGFSGKLESKLRDTLKAGTNQILKDTANFTARYSELAAEALGNGIKAFDFSWSSENHHFARIHGMIDLVAHLAEGHRRGLLDPDEGVLLMGHSHAGQIFALMNLMLQRDSQESKDFRRILGQSFDLESIDKNLRELHGKRVYYITLGTPPRYPWVGRRQSYLLNIVNHRGKTLVTSGFRGVLNTRSGDYIQKFAITGSDLVSSIKAERELNRKMDPILGQGSHLALWRKESRSFERPLNAGFTILTDMKDFSAGKVNFVQSVLGHGAYTRYDNMLFLHSLVCHHFFERALD